MSGYRVLVGRSNPATVARYMKKNLSKRRLGLGKIDKCPRCGRPGSMTIQRITNEVTGTVSYGGLEVNHYEGYQDGKVKTGSCYLARAKYPEAYLRYPPHD